MAKFYVVWKGRETGIFTDWETCKKQIHEFTGPKFKSFDTQEQAQLAFEAGPDNWKEVVLTAPGAKKPVIASLFETDTLASPNPHQPELPCLVVDASFSGRTELMEFQCLSWPDRQVLFKSESAPGATNNIGEFLGLVSAARYVLKRQIAVPIYTDSKTAMAWFRDKWAKTNLKDLSPASLSPDQRVMLDRIRAAEKWLQETPLTGVRILKWETERWGENPADYGRK